MFIDSDRKDDTVTAGASTDGERKLWFDFLSKVNDRALQETGRSGATNWVLLGVVVAIVYKCVPHVPSFLATPEQVRAAGTIFFLELNSAFSFFALLFGLVAYCAPSSQRRLKPERWKRARKVLLYPLVCVWALQGFIQAWAGVRLVHSGFVRWTLIGSGIFWVGNIFFGFAQRIWKYKKAKARKVSLAEFHSGFGEDLLALVLGSFVFLFIAIPSVLALLTYLRSLGRQSADTWLTPLGAATQFLALCIIAVVLILRALSSAEKKAYLGLEQAIVVETLPPSEIKSRFVAQFLGREVADWLKEIEGGIAGANEKLQRASGSHKKRMAEIESIDGRYSLERRGRAEKLVRELGAAADEHMAAIESFGFQLNEYASKFALSPQEAAMLTSVIVQLKASVEAARAHSATTNEALDKFRALLTKDS